MRQASQEERDKALHFLVGHRRTDAIDLGIRLFKELSQGDCVALLTKLETDKLIRRVADQPEPLDSLLPEQIVYELVP